MAAFFKSHGIGNDYIILDARSFGLAMTPERIRRLCDRHKGIGGDGILWLEAGDTADFAVRIYNPDGSEAEKSGNGLRILTHHIHKQGLTNKLRFTISIMGGKEQVTAHVHRETGDFSIEMGQASFNPEQVPSTLAGPASTLKINGHLLTVTPVGVGNPHCVIFTPELDDALVKKLGPLIECHPAFPKRSNVQWVKVHDRRTIELRIWERGAGITLASGSSSCAAAAASVQSGQCDGDIRVKMPGGQLHLTVDEHYNLTMRGPVEAVMSGQVARSLMEDLTKL